MGWGVTWAANGGLHELGRPKGGGWTAWGRPPSGTGERGETATPKPGPHPQDHKGVGGENGPTRDPPPRPSPALPPARTSPGRGARALQPRPGRYHRTGRGDGRYHRSTGGRMGEE